MKHSITWGLWISSSLAAAAVGLLVSLPTVSSAAAADDLDNDEGFQTLQSYWGDLYNEGDEDDEDKSSSSWFNKNDDTSSSLELLSMKLAAKAAPDECYQGLGNNQNQYPFDPDTQPCSGQLKVNEAYVFSMTESNGLIWFGTVSNMLCMVYGSMLDSSPFNLPIPPNEGPGWTCELQDSQYGSKKGLPRSSGDWRPSSIYTYDPATQKLEKRLSAVTSDDPLLQETLGFRAAGTVGDVVFLGGPTISGVGGPAETAGINLFAFHAQTGEYLGSQQFLEYSNIRKFVVIQDSLYTGVAVTQPGDDGDGETTPTAAGAVLRWIGSVANPFDFEVVGWLDGPATELVEHDGRLFVGTWPDYSKMYDEEFNYAGIWQSPAIVNGGSLGTTDANSWTKVWQASDYEADDVTARVYHMGGMASFEGYLYWGSFHIPFAALAPHSTIHGHSDSWPFGLPNFAAIAKVAFGSHRPVNIFRAQGFGTSSEKVDLLYGLRRMPVYEDGRWKVMSNKMGGQKPLYGLAGFANYFNVYTWSAIVHNGKLYMGTLDGTHTFFKITLPWLIRTVLKDFSLPRFANIPVKQYGSDLFVFPSSKEKGVPVDRTGLQNDGSFGIRTMLSLNNTLYLGMANTLNLVTDEERGTDYHAAGWELVELSPSQCSKQQEEDDGGGRDSSLRLFASAVRFRKCLFNGRCLRDVCPLPLYEDASCCSLDFDKDGDVDFRDLLSLPWQWVRRFFGS